MQSFGRENQIVRDANPVKSPLSVYLKMCPSRDFVDLWPSSIQRLRLDELKAVRLERLQRMLGRENFADKLSSS